MSITERISDIPALVRMLFPDAAPEQRGRRLRCGDQHGAPGTSFIINAESGWWHDFAPGESGDIVDLLIGRGYGDDAGAIYRWLADTGWLGDAGWLPAPPPRPAPRPAHFRQLMPAPADAAPPTPRQIDAHARRIDLVQDAPASVYVYRLADGRPVLCLVRYQIGGSKRPSRWSWGGRQWHPWGTTNAAVPLYRLPELLANADKAVLLVEGEKTADAAAHVLPGYAATCALGGASPAHGTDWTPLAGRDVVIAPDYDRAGFRFADKAGSLAVEAGAARVRYIAPDDLYRAMTGRDDAPPRGWDIADLVDTVDAVDAVDGESTGKKFL